MTENHGSSSDHYPDAIAIVGAGLRLPGNISSVAELLAALHEGRNCVTEIPPERWSLESFYDADPVTPGKTYVRHGGFVSDADRFDASFFGISDAEAARMDPQHRVILETVWHALEDAGQSPDELAKTNTGVFLAMMNTNNYNHLKAIYEGLEGITGYDTMADAMSIAAGRIAHFLDLQGPCFALDTACSGSMVALHQARQSILAGECDSAIVVGVNLILHPGVHVAFSKVGLMSRSGQCRAFDESADGYIRGEGCVAVLLRREADAIARNDRILASIVCSAVTQDGRTLTVTAPNGQMQEQVIRLALGRGGVNPADIGYVEAHGTGTPVGDPIEMTALVNAYGQGRSEQQPLFVGSVKSNFGHIEAGAGLLGVVKASLSLQEETIFPSLHFKQMNPNINLGGRAVRVPTASLAWQRNGRARMAGVNSFGFSGTNAHTILREAPGVPDVTAGRESQGPELVVLSAKTAQVLQELAGRWTDAVERRGAADLHDIAFTAATGRSQMRHRLAVVAQDRDDLADKLHSWREGRMSKGVFAGQAGGGRKPRIGFVFTGQGAQYAGMGRQLYETEPFFKMTIDRCAALMDGELGTPLTEILFDDTSRFLENTRYVQPALFAVEYALSELLRIWGIVPDAVIGHSVGEIVAACVAGVIDLEGAVSFVMARGRLMGQLPAGGKMLAIDATAEEAQAWLAGKEEDASIAGINGPRSIVVAGRSAAVDEIARQAAAAARRTKQLDVSHAFHSPLMDPILDRIDEAARSLSMAAGRIPLFSNVSGARMGGEIPANYWSSHVRQPVLFYQGVAGMIEHGCTILLEIGPSPALTPAIAAAFDSKTARVIPTLMRDRQDSFHMLEAAGALYAGGAAVNLDFICRRPESRRVALPLYPFRRDKHWLREDLGLDIPTTAATPVPDSLHPVLGRIVNFSSRRAVFENNIAAGRPWVDHRIMGYTVFPGTGYLEMAARGFATFKGIESGRVTLNNVMFERPLMLAYGTPKKVHLSLEPASAGTGSFLISVTDDGRKVTHCQGRAAARADGSLGQIPLQPELGRMQSKLPLGPFYGDAREVGFEYGANFATVRELWLGQPGSGEAVARISASPATDAPADHPFSLSTVLDGALQVIRTAATSLGETEMQGIFVPKSITSLTLSLELPPQVWSHVSVQTTADDAIVSSIRLTNDAGDVLVVIEQLVLQRMSRLSLARGGPTAPSAKRVLASRDELLARLQVLPPQERVGVVSKWVIEEIKDILGQAAEEIDPAKLDASTAFIEIGLDSLLVTELQRRIQEKLEFRFKAMQGLDYQSIDSLAQYIVSDVLLVEPGSRDQPRSSVSASKVAAE